MNLYQRCGRIGTGTSIFNSATKAIRPSAVSSRAALHTPAKKERYPTVIDTSRILHSSKPIPVRTLFHRWFKQEDYVDLSDARGVVASAGSPQGDLGGVEEANMPYITYWRQSDLRDDPKRRQLTYFPFPVNTRGFLYFWQHGTFPIASGIRFRIAQEPNVNGFLQGRDLQTPYGTPWHIPLVALASSPRHGILQDVLQEDGYIPPQLFQYCAELKHADVVGQWSQLIFLRGQPFYLDLSIPRSKIFLAGMNGLRGIYLGDDLFSETPYPFKSGIVSCQFETRSNWVALRVLRVIEPVQFIDQYEGSVDMLQPGQLVTSGGQPQLFLSRRDKKGIDLSRRWQYVSSRNTFPWSWQELQHEAGNDWKFPWNVRKKAAA